MAINRKQDSGKGKTLENNFKEIDECGPRISIARMHFPLDGETRFFI